MNENGESKASEVWMSSEDWMRFELKQERLEWNGAGAGNRREITAWMNDQWAEANN